MALALGEALDKALGDVLDDSDNGDSSAGDGGNKGDNNDEVDNDNVAYTYNQFRNMAESVLVLDFRFVDS